MQRFLDAASDRSDMQSSRGLIFEPYGVKVLSVGGTFQMRVVGGKAVAPFTNVHGVSLLDAGSGGWSLTIMSRAPITYFDRSVGASDVDSLAAAIAQVDWDNSRSTMFLYPSWHEFPAIDALRLPDLLFQVCVGWHYGSKTIDCTGFAWMLALPTNELYGVSEVRYPDLG